MGGRGGGGGWGGEREGAAFQAQVMTQEPISALLSATPLGSIFGLRSQQQKKAPPKNNNRIIFQIGALVTRFIGFLYPQAHVFLNFEF